MYKEHRNHNEGADLYLQREIIPGPTNPSLRSKKNVENPVGIC